MVNQATLSVMQSLIGTEWEKGDKPSPIITGWLNFIGQQYPIMSSYCKSAAGLDYFEWCGLAVGYCMAKSNIAPVFVSPRMETDDFLWAYAWLNWGQIKSTPSPGDVVVFNWGGGNAHVTLFVRDLGNGYWTCLGGNQSNQVKESNFPKSCVVGIRAVPSAQVAAHPAMAATSLGLSTDDRFQRCVGYVLSDEGGDVDDSRDPGGRTSRGITENDWSHWLQSHPSLPTDVFDAPQDQIEAIYRAWYWNLLNGDELPPGVDYAVFDYGILSGVRRASRSLQKLVGVTTDGGVGAQTIRAVKGADPAQLVNDLCADRLQEMRRSPVWSVYGAGWTARVNRVKTRALGMISGSGGQPEAVLGLVNPTYTRVAKTISPNRQIRRFGWKPDLPDYRDHLFSAPMRALQNLPPMVSLTPEFEIYDQGEIGSCTANALAGAIQFDRLKNGQAPDFVPSRLFIYYNERVVENDVGLDGGAYLRDGIKILNQLGVCPETSWPYDSTPAAYDGGPFPAGSPPATQPPDRCFEEALKYSITSYQRLTPTLAQLQGCLASGYPFVFGFSVYSSWYDQDPRPATISLPGDNDNQVGGHAVLCVGYDNATLLFKIRNSWGPTAGDRGYFYMPYSYLTGGLASDFWVINAVAD
jgi:uncharacterized protein (TIGR02594 family)